jgi:hypothetical protein
MKTILGKLAIAATLCLAASPGVHAQAYPNKPIRMVVPYSPGGATDIMGRVVAQRLGEILGQQIASLHNLGFYIALMTEARERILDGSFSGWKAQLLPLLKQRITG